MKPEVAPLMKYGAKYSNQASRYTVLNPKVWRCLLLVLSTQYLFIVVQPAVKQEI